MRCISSTVKLTSEVFLKKMYQTGGRCSSQEQDVAGVATHECHRLDLVQKFDTVCHAPVYQ